MRKNKVNRNSLTEVFVRYEITGLNLDNFIVRLKKKDVNLYNVKRWGLKKMRLSIQIQDNENFFAIIRELCYNVKKIKEYGKHYPFLYLKRKVGLAVGAIIFLCGLWVSSDFVFAIDYLGSGSIYSRQVGEYLQSVGVSKFSRFSAIDLDVLGDGILASTDKLSFATCRKVGNRLSITLVLSDTSGDRLSGNQTSLVATEDGVVESLKVYRGTAQFKVGDYVKKGDVIVDGYAIIKEQRVEVNVLARVSILTQTIVEYKSLTDNEEEVALLFATQSVDGQIVASSVYKKEQNGEFIYAVTLTLRKILFVG